DAVYLRGEMPVTQVTLDELDRVLGTLYAQVEECFQALLRIGFASHF
ncbi:MAG: YbjN domain-containing protein, partial [Actinobacteria bacterium]